jgi:hypothetical protein
MRDTFIRAIFCHVNDDCLVRPLALVPAHISFLEEDASVVTIRIAERFRCHKMLLFVPVHVSWRKTLENVTIRISERFRCRKMLSFVPAYVSSFSEKDASVVKIER